MYKENLLNSEISSTPNDDNYYYVENTIAKKIIDIPINTLPKIIDKPIESIPKKTLDTNYCKNYLNTFSAQSEFIKTAVLKGVNPEYKSESETKTIEKFSLLGGLFGTDPPSNTTIVKNSTSNTKLLNRTQIKDLTSIEENIDKSTLVQGMTKMLTNVITKVTNDNKAALSQLIVVSNSINVDGLTIGGDLNVSGIKQSNKIDTKVEMKSVQDIANKIQVDISNSISSIINSTIKDTKDTINNKSNISQEATNVGNVVTSLAKTAGDVVNGITDNIGSVANNMIDTTGKVLSSILGPSTNTNTSTNTTVNVDKSTISETDKQLKSLLNLNQSFKSIQDNSISQDISNILDNKNIAECVSNLQASNTISYKNTTVKGNANFTDLIQANDISAVMNCAFNQKVITDISVKIVNNYAQNITNMVANANITNNTIANHKTIGDIYAVGVAGAAVISSGGAAISGIIGSSSIFFIVGGIIAVALVIWLMYSGATVGDFQGPANFSGGTNNFNSGSITNFHGGAISNFLSRY